MVIVKIPSNFDCLGGTIMTSVFIEYEVQGSIPMSFKLLWGTETILRSNLKFEWVPGGSLDWTRI